MKKQLIKIFSILGAPLVNIPWFSSIKESLTFQPIQTLNNHLIYDPLKYKHRNRHQNNDLFSRDDRSYLICDLGRDLLLSLLDFNPSDRISSHEALSHPYFHNPK
jgi:serine/threonine protein kinase